MKRILLALTMVGLLLPLTTRAQADAAVSLNFFYDNLSSQGNWIEVGDYGYCFQPNAAVSNSDWRPYADGYWAYTDAGWTWVSYEDFGWATYHYGRWTNLDSYGWVWVPGYEWAPAWVSWRTGGDYVGWAPLPPGGDQVYEGRAITSAVDVEFDIGPLYYNFVDIRYIGEPVLRGRILEPSRNVTIINRTVNVTNITYNNSIVYNYGPDYNRLNQYSTRPIQRLRLQRETTVGTNLSQGRKGGNFNRVNGNQLTVVAPIIQKSQQQIAPKQVKAKVEKPNVEHGWKGVQNRPQVETAMKQENSKNVPAPDIQPQKGRNREEVAGGEHNAKQQPQKAAEQQQGGAQNAAAVDQQPQRNDQNANRVEAQRNRQLENQNRRNRGGERPTSPENAPPAAAQQSDGSQPDQSQQDSKQKSDSQQMAEERRTRRAQQNDQENSHPERDQRADGLRNVKKAQSAEETQTSETGTPDNNRVQHPEKAQEAHSAQTAGNEPAGRPEAQQESNRPERGQRPQQNRGPAQARPQHKQEQEPGDQNPNEQRKKKKPADEPPPQP